MSKPNDPDGDKKSKHEHNVLVRGAIQTHTSPEDEKKRTAERQADSTTRVAERDEDRRRESHKLVVEWLTLLAVIIYAGIAAWQGCLSRDQLKVGQRGSRPFVGIVGFGVNHQWTDKDGKAHGNGSTPTVKDTGMVVEVHIKNFGPMPALQFNAERKMYLDRVEIPGEGNAAIQGTLNPTQEFHFTTFIGGSTYQSVMASSKILTVRVDFSYDGPEGRYHECTMSKFEPSISAFFDEGFCGSAVK